MSFALVLLVAVGGQLYASERDTGLSLDDCRARLEEPASLSAMAAEEGFATFDAAILTCELH